MKKLYILTTIIITLLLFHGCKKSNDLACLTQTMPVAIQAISGPDSLKRNEQESLVFEIDAPGLCVKGIDINMSYYADTIYYAEAVARYAAGSGQGCNCEVKERHYVRVFFSSPQPGTVTIQTPPGNGPFIAHTIKVY